MSANIMIFDPPLYRLDPDLSFLLAAESSRQERSLYLSAGASLTPRAVREASASDAGCVDVEGYPSRSIREEVDDELLNLSRQESRHFADTGGRISGGTAFIDIIEELARRRAERLFATDGPLFANVQAATGSIAVTA